MRQNEKAKRSLTEEEILECIKSGAVKFDRKGYFIHVPVEVRRSGEYRISDSLYNKLKQQLIK